MAASNHVREARDAMRAAEKAIGGPGANEAHAEWLRRGLAYYLALHPEERAWLPGPPDALPSVAEIRARADVYHRAHQAIPGWGRIDPRPGRHAEWSARLAWATEAAGGIYTTRFDACLTNLQAGRSDDLEYAIRFLEADPWCFGSGYVKSRLIRALLQLALDAETCRRLRGALLTAVDDDHNRREYREYVRLARRIADAELTTALAPPLLGRVRACSGGRSAGLFTIGCQRKPGRDAAPGRV
jgi:hypothetical protein